jgi:hypothetical protein
VKPPPLPEKVSLAWIWDGAEWRVHIAAEHIPDFLSWPKGTDCYKADYTIVKQPAGLVEPKP